MSKIDTSGSCNLCSYIDEASTVSVASVNVNLDVCVVSV